MLHWLHPQWKCWILIGKNSGMKQRVLQWVRLVGIKKNKTQWWCSDGKRDRKERERLSFYGPSHRCYCGNWNRLPSQPVMLRHLIFCLSSFLLSQWCWSSPFSLRLSSFVSLSPFVRKPFSSHLPALPCHSFFSSTFQCEHSLKSSFKVCTKPLLVGTLLLYVYVCRWTWE